MKKILHPLLVFTKHTIYGIIIQSILATTLLAIDGKAQFVQNLENVNLTFRLEEATIQETIDILEKKSGFKFNYNVCDLDRKLTLNGNYQAESLYEILVDISRQANVKFKQVNNNISVSPNDKGDHRVEVVLQTSTVTGRVTSEDSPDGLPGANVIIKGTTMGTVTDISGNYSIEVPGPQAVLVFSSVGFISEEVTVGSRAVVDITMVPDIQSLSEVVVVGYGTQRKADLTGAVSSVDVKAVENAPNTNVGQMLQGAVPGLNVGMSTTAGGTPSIGIRGRSTLGGSENVLVILDGIQYTGSISSINPDDIASIDVLKDASSAAVYGAQGANGVLLITTKKGLTGEPRISYSGSYSFQSPTKEYRSLNREEFLEELKYKNWDEAFLAPDYTTPNPDWDPINRLDASQKYLNENGETVMNPYDYDWIKEGTTKPTIMEHNLSVSGGLKDKISYLFSASSVKQQNFIKADKFDRKTLRANLEITPNEYLKIGLVSSGSFVNQDGAEPNLYYLGIMPPLLKPYDDEGNLIVNPFNNTNINPLAAHLVDDYDRTQYYFANIYAELTVPFIKGLKYRVNYGHNLNQRQHYYSSEYDASATGLAYKSTNHYYDYTLDNIVTYERSFGKHKATLTGLYGVVERENSDTYAEGKGFSRLTLGYNSLETADVFSINSDAWSEALNYQMARLNYSYSDKYLLAATIRRDGFSGFAENHKWGVFPSGSIGWVVSNENFLDNTNALSFLKLRVGYGSIGNQTSRYSSIAKVQTRAAYVFGDGGSTAFGQYVETLPNPNLKWERTVGLNVGVDFIALNNKLSGTLEYYNDNTHDLLYPVDIPSLTGYDTVLTNLGQLNNKGLEASLTYQVIDNDQFNWQTTFNIWRNVNKIVKLLGKDDNGDGVEDDLIASNYFIGRSIGTIYDFKRGDIYQVGDDIPEGFYPGTLRVEDLNNDGEWDPEHDRTFLGRREPAYSFSIYNVLSYKMFTLSFLINSIQGGKNGYLENAGVYYQRDDVTLRESQLVGTDYWSPSNPDGKYPRNVSASAPIRTPPMFESRSFVRLQDVSLSYNLPGTVLSKIGAERVNIYASAKNLITWTKWDGFDPETGSIALAGRRPVMRAITFGLRVTY